MTENKTTCGWCAEPFKKRHFNQKMCSDDCRLLARRDARKRYSETEKGKASHARWLKSETRKASAVRYRQKSAAKRNAVARTTKYLKKYEHNRVRKRQRDRLYSSTEKGKEASRRSGAVYRERKRQGLSSRPTATPERLDDANSFTLSEWNAKLDEHNHQCANCKSGLDLTMDHVMPLSKGGSNTIDNIQVLCRACNASKGNKVPA